MSAEGKWRIEVIGMTFILELKAAGPGKLPGTTKLTGTMVEEGGNAPQPIENGWEKGNKVHWEVTKPFETMFDGEVSGDNKKMKGTAKASKGSVGFTGTRL